jgi:cell division protein FtsA
MATFYRGVLTHTAVVPIGGESFTSDLAYGLKVPLYKAEELKARYGTTLSSTIDSVAAVKLDDRHYNASFISQILEYRAHELYDYVQDSLQGTRMGDLIPGGVVLTGGGSLLDGMTDLAEEVLGLRARAVVPQRVRGEVKPVQKPQYATSVGLLYFSARNDDPRPKGKGAGAGSFGSILEAVRGWFRGK